MTVKAGRISLLLAIASAAYLGAAQTNGPAESKNVSANKGVEMSDLKPQINWQPEGKPEWHPDWMNGYVRGLELSLNKAGFSVDYNTMMGDIGQAFAMQGEDMNKIDGAVDVGWWPNEPMSLIRLAFLEKTVGCEIKEIKIPNSENENVKKQPIETFKKCQAPAIKASLAAGVPCVAGYPSTQYVITGMDDGTYPLIGMCPNEQKGKEKIYRIQESLPVWQLLIPGGKLKKIDRTQADREALSYAIALHKDEILGGNTDAAKKFSLADVSGYKQWGWHTGKGAYAVWEKCLADNEHVGQGRWHANAQWSLVRNRKTAVAYLREMEKRHNNEAKNHLEKACQHYEAVIAEMINGNTSDAAIGTNEGRKSLISIVQSVTALEDKAVSELEKALAALK